MQSISIHTGIARPRCCCSSSSSSSTTTATGGRRLATRRGLRHGITSPAAAARDTSLTADYVVVGSGIVGLCVARRLLLDGHSVVVTDRQQPCAGATGAGQGYIWMGHRDPSSPLWQLASQGKAGWEALARQDTQLARALEWQANGSLLLATTAEDARALSARQQALVAAGVADVQLLGTQELRELEPALSVPTDAMGLFVPSDAQLNGRAAAEALLQECSRLGAQTCLHQATTAVTPDAGGHGVTVTTTQGRLHAEQGVVVAAGVWSGQVLAAATGDQRWQAMFAPRRGHLLELVPPAAMAPLRTAMMELAYTKYYGAATSAVDPAGLQHDLDIIFTATSSAAGNLLVGSSREFAGWDTTSKDAVVRAILQHAKTFLPCLPSDVDHGQVRVGLRPYALAGMPVVGWVPGLPGVAVAAGHEGSGLCLGPSTADIIADLLHGSGAPKEAFSPARRIEECKIAA